MKKIIFTLLLLPSIAYAGDEEFECTKNHKQGYAVECKAKKNGVAVNSIEINGGECSSPINSKIHHKLMQIGQKFIVPGSKECGYVAGVTVHTHSGKIEHFTAM